MFARFALALAVAGSSCTGTLTTTASNPQSPPSEEQAVTHFPQLLEAHEALMDGDVGTAASHATVMTFAPDPREVPETALSHFRALNTAAEQATLAGDVVGTAEGLAKAAAACGSCHGAMSGTLSSGDPTPSARLLAGLVWPASGQWEAGMAEVAEFAAPPAAADRFRQYAEVVAALQPARPRSSAY